MSEVNVGNTEVDVVEQTSDDLSSFENEFFGREPETTNEEVEEVETAEADQGADAEEADTAAENDPDGDDAEADEEDDEGEDEVDEPEPEPSRKNRKTAKERISELSAKNREKDRALAELTARLESLERRSEPKPETKTAKQADDAPDFDAVDKDGELLYPLGQIDPKFIEDNVRYLMRKEREADNAAREEQAKLKELETAEAQLKETWGGKLDAAEAETPGLITKIAELEETFADLDEQHGIFLAQTIMQMERGPEVLAYLADNIDDAERIVASSPVVATLALGEIHGLLPTKTKPAATKVSKAPTPPKVTRGTGVSTSVPGDTNDLAAFERAYYKK